MLPRRLRYGAPNATLRNGRPSDGLGWRFGFRLLDRPGPDRPVDLGVWLNDCGSSHRYWRPPELCTFARLIATIIPPDSFSPGFMSKLNLLSFHFSAVPTKPQRGKYRFARSEEHTSELQSRENLVCRLLLEKKKK